MTDLSLYSKLYLIATPIFFAIDMVWLGVVARTFYAQQIGHLMTSNVNWAAALLFYFLFIFGVLLFAVVPGIKADSMITAVLLGAAFGFFTYATYDLTNLATLKNWPLLVTVVDLAWGTTLSATVSGLTYFVAKSFLKI